jgi:hypothetical protein
LPYRLQFGTRFEAEQPQPEKGFLGLFATDLEVQKEILLPQGLIRLDVVCSNRARRSDELLPIFKIANGSWNPLKELPNSMSEVKSTFFQVIIPLQFFDAHVHPLFGFGIWYLVFGIWYLVF